jgi:hypothetical protein
VRFRLARGPVAPSGEIPPRSRVGHPLGASLRLARGPHGLAVPVPAPPIGAFNVLTPAGAQVKDESTHVVPLTRLGNHIPALFRQPSGRGHPRHCTALCGKARVSSVTLCHPLSYDRRAAPSKEDGGALKGGTDACSAPAQDHAVTSDQRGASHPSPSALCGHPKHCSAIPDAVGTRGGRTPPRPPLCPVRPPVSCTLESSHERRPNRRLLRRHPQSRSWTDTGHAMTPARGKICQDGRLLRSSVRHTITRR